MRVVAAIDAATLQAQRPADVHDQCVHAWLGEAAESYAVANCGSLIAAQTALYDAVRTGMLVETQMASSSKNVAKVSSAAHKFEWTSASGDLVVYDTPRTCKDIDTKPDAAEWLRAASDAFWLAIVALPGNEICEEWEAKGEPIGEFVSVFRYKHQEPGEPPKRKVRRSIDDARLLRRATPEQRLEMLRVAAYTMPVGELEQNMFLASIMPNEWLCLIDWKDAYGIGHCERAPRYARPPAILDVKAASGGPGLLRYRTSIWGERPAGNEFEIARDEDMEACGWLPVLDVSALFHHGSDRGAAIIDDLALKVSNLDTAYALRDGLSARSVARGGAPVTMVVSATRWGGIEIERSLDGKLLTSHMATHIEGSIRKWLPDVADGKPLPSWVPQGAKLRAMLDELEIDPTASQSYTREVQSLVGDLRWIRRRVVHIEIGAHKLSCVAHAPPATAMPAALGVLYCAHENKSSGFTYGGDFGATVFTGALAGTENRKRRSTVHKVDGEQMYKGGAPTELQGASDATWSLVRNNKPKDVLALALTANGAAVLIELKNAGVMCGSSAEVEMLALLKLSDKAVYGRLVWSRLGMKIKGPTLLLSDADSSLRACSGEASAVRLRHSLRRTTIVLQRVRADEVMLAHVPDALQYVDFLTKWVDQAKVTASIDYLTGAAARRRGARVQDVAANAAIAMLAERAEAHETTLLQIINASWMGDALYHE